MNKIFVIIFVFFSSSVFSQVNDVYYCETFHNKQFDENNDLQLGDRKFKFKRYENELVFGKNFDHLKLKLDYSEGEAFGGITHWRTGSGDAVSNNMITFSMYNSIFTYTKSWNGFFQNSIYALIANCEVFN